MICKNLAYWVFTSGEEGVHGLDWGIKHTSKSFADRYKLDSRYRLLLKAFSLLPSLERPQKGAGLILLPWQGQGKDGDEGALMGFIFPGNDHKGRPNISTVACVVPADVLRTLTLSEVVRALWCSNDLERIARRNSVRPDTLSLDEKAPSAAEVPLPIPPSLKWPGKDVGYLMMDGRVRDLRGFCPPLYPPTEGAAEKRKLRTPWFVALFAVLALALGGACLLGFNCNSPQSNEGNSSSSDKPSDDLKTTERRKEGDKIIVILSRNRGGNYLEGLAGLIWVPNLWKDEVSSDDLRVAAEISGGFIANLSNEKWWIEKSDQEVHGNQEKKLINVSEFKKSFIKTIGPSLEVEESDRGDSFNINPREEGIEAWDRLKNDLKDKLSQFIDTMKNANFPSKTATHTIAEDEETLKKHLDNLLEKTEAPENQTDGYGHLSFFYGDGEEGYQVLLLNMEDLSEGKKLDKYIFVKKTDKWRRINVSDLEKRLDRTPRDTRDRPCIEFDDDRKDITFFLVPKSKREKGGDFEKFLGVFLDDLLDSVSVEE